MIWKLVVIASCISQLLAVPLVDVDAEIGLGPNRARLDGRLFGRGINNFIKKVVPGINIAVSRDSRDDRDPRDARDAREFREERTQERVRNARRESEMTEKRPRNIMPMPPMPARSMPPPTKVEYTRQVDLSSNIDDTPKFNFFNQENNDRNTNQYQSKRQEIIDNGLGRGVNALKSTTSFHSPGVVESVLSLLSLILNNVDKPQVLIPKLSETIFSGTTILAKLNGVKCVGVANNALAYKNKMEVAARDERMITNPEVPWDTPVNTKMMLSDACTGGVDCSEISDFVTPDIQEKIPIDEELTTNLEKMGNVEDERQQELRNKPQLSLGALDGLLGAAGTVVQDSLKGASGAVAAVGKVSDNAVKAATGLAANVGGAAAGAVGSVGNAAVNAVSRTAELGAKVGEGAVNTLVNGAQGVAGAALNAAGQVGRTAANAVNTAARLAGKTTAAVGI